MAGNENFEQGRMRDVNVPLIFTIGLISSLLLIVIITGVQAWYHFEAYQERVRKVYAVENPDLVELRHTQLGRITQYRWVDEQAGQAAVPIEEAMRLLAEREAGRGGEDATN